jgi:quercetin dioxygenase-like cupin family protein
MNRESGLSFVDSLRSSNTRLDAVNKRLDNLKLLFNMAPIDDLQVVSAGFTSKGIDGLTVFQNEDATVTLGTWKFKSTIWPDHCHSDSLEYLIVTRGTVLVRFGEASRIMGRGECAAIPRGLKHSVQALEDDSQILGVCIPPEIAYLTGEITCPK